VTEVWPCFFLGCKANARVKLAKTGHGPHSSIIFVLFYVLFVCKCVLYYCHRVFVCKCVLYYCHRMTTQLQLTNISYHVRILVTRLPLGHILFVGYFLSPLPVTPALFLNFSLREGTLDSSAEVVNKHGLPRISFPFHVNDKLITMFIYIEELIKSLNL
jgi:hypothetical protein